MITQSIGKVYSGLAEELNHGRKANPAQPNARTTDYKPSSVDNNAKHQTRETFIRTNGDLTLDDHSLHENSIPNQHIYQRNLTTQGSKPHKTKGRHKEMSFKTTSEGITKKGDHPSALPDSVLHRQAFHANTRVPKAAISRTQNHDAHMGDRRFIAETYDTEDYDDPLIDDMFNDFYTDNTKPKNNVLPFDFDTDAPCWNQTNISRTRSKENRERPDKERLHNRTTSEEPNWMSPRKDKRVKRPISDQTWKELETRGYSEKKQRPRKTGLKWARTPTETERPEVTMFHPKPPSSGKLAGKTRKVDGKVRHMGDPSVVNGYVVSKGTVSKCTKITANCFNIVNEEHSHITNEICA